MERLLDRPAAKTMRDAAATIRTLGFLVITPVAGSFSIVILARKQLADNRLLAVVAIVVGAVALVVVAGHWYYIAYRCDPAAYKITDLEGLLIIESAGPHRKYTNIRRTTVRAMRNNVRFIEHRSHWTGIGSKNRRVVESLVDEHQLFVSRRPEEDGRLQLSVYLGGPLSRGEETQVAIREVFEDDIEPMHQYYRKGGGRYPARNLTVITRFSLGEEPHRVEGLMWNNDRKSRERPVVRGVQYDRIPDPVNGTVDYIVTVKRPKRYHSYGVRWTWSPPGGLPAPRRPGEASISSLSSSSDRRVGS